jgi:hypothetical protein
VSLSALLERRRRGGSKAVRGIDLVMVRGMEKEDGAEIMGCRFTIIPSVSFLHLDPGLKFVIDTKHDRLCHHRCCYCDQFQFARLDIFSVQHVEDSSGVRIVRSQSSDAHKASIIVWCHEH